MPYGAGFADPHRSESRILAKITGDFSAPSVTDQAVASSELSDRNAFDGWRPATLNGRL